MYNFIGISVLGSSVLFFILVSPGVSTSFEENNPVGF